MARPDMDTHTALSLAEASLEQLQDRRTWLLAEIADVELEIEGLKRAIQRCHCPCHAVIQPGLIPCPSCATNPDHSSRSAPKEFGDGLR